MTLSSNKTEYNAVDLVKFICSLIVVAGHIPPFGYTDNTLLYLFNYGAQNLLARITVPIFFMASGFFLYRKTRYEDFSLNPIKAYVMKILKVYLIWTLIYMPVEIKPILADEKGIIHGILVFVHKCIFLGSSGQLWYFPALIFAVLTISFLISKKIRIENILIIGLIFYTLGLLTQSWFGLIKPIETIMPELWYLLKLIQKVIGTARNGLFMGILFVGMGAEIAFNGFRISQKKALVLFIISFFLMSLELMFVAYVDFIREYYMYIFLVPSTYFASGFIVNYRMDGDKKIFKTMRILSALIYYMHLMVGWSINDFFYMLGFEIDKTCLLYILTVVLCIVYSLIIIKLSDYPRFKWLKSLYS